MIRTIEKSDSAMIQKVMVGAKVLRYQVVPKGEVGNSLSITAYSTLASARIAAGIDTTPKRKEG